ncbi:DNA topoisomerase 3 [Peptoniphilus equinus]|uniref:DNA topoisomerase n=1 Tax=Peptoniphilus equinus TaxID=3016343 RepID=A0ABY7QS77_9FIRM|nr:type IA DNA topoisomerase [Peptoniphilus equinus]WBW49316.1 DNA topoisomerase 3 [Peptoniphilus equinus]
MKLVVAEKPSVAQDIARVIGATNREQGYLEGNGYMVTWCFGHLVTLAPPEAYGEEYKSWRVDTLPIFPESFKYAVIKNSAKQYAVVKNLMHNNRVTSIVCATDAGREGELIFMLVYNQSKCHKPVERLWISSMEDRAIAHGFETLKPESDYTDVYHSALARLWADWLVGMNATRLYSVLYNDKLTVGRVQTPTLAMITARDQAIEQFQKEKYYTVEINNELYTLSTERIDNAELAKQIINNLPDSISIDHVETKEKTTRPVKLFDLTALQRACNKYFGYSAKQTLDYAQSLYEKKFITYPRTDSRYLTEDMETTVVSYFNKLNFQYDETNFKRIFNSKKVSDHHALIPTLSSLDNLDSMDIGERKVFNLIQCQLLASSDANVIESITKVATDIDGVIFKASGKTIIQEGFAKHFKAYETKKESVLPEIYEGDIFRIQDSKIQEKYTSPPPHYTEETLLLAMEKAGKEDLDKELDVEKKGLGTPATRAGIIEKLIATNYVTRDKKNLLATEKAFRLIEIVSDSLKNASTTAEWENELTRIANGDSDPKAFMDSIKDEVKRICCHTDVKAEYVIPREDRESLGSCPKCGSSVIEGKKVYFCTNNDCDFRVFKEICNKKINKTVIKDLLSKGMTEKIPGFLSKKGTIFSAKLVIKDDNTIEFKFK